MQQTVKKEDVRMKEKKHARACGDNAMHGRKESDAQDCREGKEGCGADTSCHDDDCGC